MAESEQSTTAAQRMQQRLPLFFTAIAPDYGTHTGNTTQDLFSKFLQQADPKITFGPSSKIHDNAAGPGTATRAIIELQGSENQPTIVATDSVPAMVEVFNKSILENKDTWAAKVTAEVADSHSLPHPNNTFTHSICNFSIFTFFEPVIALKEIYRTLKPGGVAVITTWRRFGVGEVMSAAQRAVQGPNAQPVPVQGQQFMQEGVLATELEKAGFDKTKIRTTQTSLIVKDGKDLDGIVNFMTGPFTAVTRAHYSDEDKSKWPEAVKTAIADEKKTHGGLLMQAWNVTAEK